MSTKDKPTMNKTIPALLASLVFLSPLLAADWTQQMGPNRDGVVSGDSLATEWKDGKLPVLWQQNAGFGMAPVVVEQGRLYTFGLFKPGTKPEDIVLPAFTPTFEEVQTGSILDGQAQLIWLTHDFVPYVEIGKSNLLVHDGKFYGADAHGIWDTPGKPSAERWGERQPGRNFRGQAVGSFQCRDVLTGKLLWSTSVFQPATVDPLKWPGEWSSTHSILAGDRLIVFNRWGLWIARLTDSGVTVLAQAPGFEREGSEPVLVDGRLYVRQIALRHSYQDEGNAPYAKGNLICYDLRHENR